MSYQVKFADEANEDLHWYFVALADIDLNIAERAMHAITKGMEMLAEFPFACRKADPDNPFLRELIISFGDTGYVVFYEIMAETTVYIWAIRDQREDDYY